MSAPPDGPWLRRYAPRERPRLRLVCFPHAGGAAQFFRTWARQAPPGLDVVAVQYPGRSERMGEDFATSVREVGARVAAAIEGDLDAPPAPVALFGHSLGAAVAFETALARERLRGGATAHLFVSGRPEPTWPGSKHLGDDDQVWAEVCRLGGTDPALAADPEVRALALPQVRADFRLSETYVCAADARVACPITAYTGRDDPDVDPATIERWRGRTDSAFSSAVFPGDHFFHVPGQAEVMADLLARLGPGVVGRLWPSTP